MIVWKRGDMLSAPGIPVIPVNCVGVMGKGLAKAAAEKWPWIVAPYKAKCDRGINALRPGGTIWEANDDPDAEHQSVVMLATKMHWRDPSQLEWIETGLRNLALSSWPAAIWNVPKLGCGLGGLDWKDVKPLMEKYLTDAPGTFNVWE